MRPSIAAKWPCSRRGYQQWPRTTTATGPGVLGPPPTTGGISSPKPLPRIGYTGPQRQAAAARGFNADVYPTTGAGKPCPRPARSRSQGTGPVRVRVLTPISGVRAPRTGRVTTSPASTAPALTALALTALALMALALMALALMAVGRGRTTRGPAARGPAARTPPTRAWRASVTTSSVTTSPPTMRSPRTARHGTTSRTT